MPKKLNKREEAEGGNTWMTTYSDMMTILFVFFVLFFTMSTINPVQWQLLVDTFGARMRTTVVDPHDLQDPMAEEMDIILQQFIADLHGTFDDEDLLNVSEMTLEDLLNQAQDDAQMQDMNEAQGQDGEPLPNFDFIYQVVSAYVEDKGYSEQIIIERADNYIMIRFRDRVLFGPGSVTIGQEGRDIILFIGTAIQLVLDEVDMIRIEGHTDSVPQSGWRFTDNWDLGHGRANAVLRILAESGLPTDRRLMMPSSLADTVPRASNDTPEGRSENRRVEIYISRLGTAEDNRNADILIDDMG